MHLLLASPRGHHVAGLAQRSCIHVARRQFSVHIDVFLDVFCPPVTARCDLLWQVSPQWRLGKRNDSSLLPPWRLLGRTDLTAPLAGLFDYYQTAALADCVSATGSQALHRMHLVWARATNCPSSSVHLRSMHVRMRCCMCSATDRWLSLPAWCIYTH